MRLAIFAPSTGRIQSVMEFPEGNADDALLNIPDGLIAVEVGENVSPGSHYIDADDNPVVYPPRPGDWSEFDFAAGEWIDPRSPDDLAHESNARRQTASMPKAAFIEACMAAGILNPGDAKTVARGDIPDSFAGAVASLTAYERDMVPIRWPAVSTIRRTDPLILAVAAAAGISHATLDALFGLSAQGA